MGVLADPLITAAAVASRAAAAVTVHVMLCMLVPDDLQGDSARVKEWRNAAGITGDGLRGQDVADVVAVLREFKLYSAVKREGRKRATNLPLRKESMGP